MDEEDEEEVGCFLRYSSCGVEVGGGKVVLSSAYSLSLSLDS